MSTDPASEPAAHWERVYETLDPTQASWYQSRPMPSLALIDRVREIHPHHGTGLRVLDIGAGTSTLVDELLAEGHDRVGVLDVSGRALDTVRRRLGSRAPRVEWLETDVTDFTPAARWDVWHDRAVFHFLTSPEDRKAYRHALRLALTDGGWIVLGVFATDGPPRCSGLDVVRYDAAALGDALGDGVELVTAVRALHRTPMGTTQAFLYGLFRYVGNPPS